MNKAIYTLLLLAASSILLGNGIVDWAKEQIDDELHSVAEKGKEKTNVGIIENEIIGKGIDALSDKASDLLFESIQEKDTQWFESKVSDKEEIRFNESMDRFFSEFNGPSLEKDASTIGVPSFSLEDRPIDFIKGGHAAAKSSRMKSALSSLSHGPVYRFLVGLETTSPLLASAVKQIQTWSNQLNAMSIQSYDIAATLLPGAQRGDNYACEHEKIGEGYDLISAKTLCQDRRERTKTLTKLAARNEQILVGSLNIAEKIFSQMGIETHQELLTNLTGTVVSDGAGRLDHYPSLYKETIALMIHGQKIPNGYCLVKDGVKRGIVEIDWKPEKEKIFDLFKSAQQKLKNDSEFSLEEKKLMESSHFPMASFITLMTQYKGPGSTLILERYSDLIAFERIVQIVEESLESILHKAKSLQSAQISGYALNTYIQQVENVLENVRTLKTENLQKIALEQKALDSLLQVEQELREKARIG